LHHLPEADRGPRSAADTIADVEDRGRDPERRRQRATAAPPV